MHGVLVEIEQAAVAVLAGALVVVPQDVEAFTSIQVHTGSQDHWVVRVQLHRVDVSVHIELHLELHDLALGSDAGDYTQ